MRLRVRPGGVVVLGVAAAAALSAPLTSAAAATGTNGATAATAVSAPAVSWPAQVARPAAVSCPRGEKLIAPTGGRTDALGVTHLTYKAVPGLVASIPPRGLTARGVTPMMIADLGMNGRSAGSADGRSGATPGDARAAAERLTKLAVRLAKDRTAPEFGRSGVKDPPNTHDYGNGNWAGYAVTESEFGGQVNGVTGTWAVPLSGSDFADEGESTWVGVGGGIGGETEGTGLIQAGTNMEYTTKDEFGYRSWWEQVGSNTCGTNDFCGKYSDTDAIVNGEEVTVYVWWDTTTSATFIVSTSGGGGEYDMTVTGMAIPYDHTSAEWVDENYLEDGLYYDSPGTVQFYEQGLSGSFGGDGSFTSPFAGSYEAVIMAIAKTTDTGCDVPGTDTPNDVVLSYPAYASNNSDGGSSDVITCDIPGTDS